MYSYLQNAQELIHTFAQIMWSTTFQVNHRSASFLDCFYLLLHQKPPISKRCREEARVASWLEAVELRPGIVGELHLLLRSTGVAAVAASWWAFNVAARRQLARRLFWYIPLQFPPNSRHALPDNTFQFIPSWWFLLTKTTISRTPEPAKSGLHNVYPTMQHYDPPFP